MLKMKRLFLSALFVLLASMLWAGSCFADDATVYATNFVNPSAWVDGYLSIVNFKMSYDSRPTQQILINSDSHGSIQVATNDNLFSVTTKRLSTGATTTQYFNTFYPGTGLIGNGSTSATDLFLDPDVSSAITGTFNNPYVPTLDFETTGSAGSGTYLNLSPQAITDLGDIEFITDYNSYYYFPCTFYFRVKNNSQTDRFLPNTMFSIRPSSINNYVFPDSFYTQSSALNNQYAIFLRCPSDVVIKAGTTYEFTWSGYYVYNSDILPITSTNTALTVGISAHDASKEDRTNQIWDRIGAFIDQDKSEYDEFTSSGSSAAYDSVVSDSSSVRGFGDSVEAVAAPVLQLFDGSRTFGEPDLVFPGLWVDVYHYPDRQNINAFYASVVPPAGSLQYSRVWSPYTFNFRTFFEQYHLGFLKTALNFATVFLVYSGLLKYLLDVWDKLMNGAYAGDQF